MIQITPSARLKTSPFFNETINDGATHFSIYNQTLLPTGFGNPENEYWNLINNVSIWDVAAERQVEITGPDAQKLIQILATRKMNKCKINQGKYVALCNHNGTIINDPLILKLEEDRFWISLADSNIFFWTNAIANERKMNVKISDPNTGPIAIQGPKAENVAQDVFGEWVKDIKYFWFKKTEIKKMTMLVARSGWSKQGGFEIYLMQPEKGPELWNIIKEAGKKYDIQPGNPNNTERIESGLLSYGGDTDDQTNPFEVRLEKYVDLDCPDDTIGIQALREIKKKGPKRHQLGIILENKIPVISNFKWFDINKNNKKIGHMTNITFSYKMEKNIGFALVSTDAKPQDEVEVIIDGEKQNAKLTEIPFI